MQPNQGLCKHGVAYPDLCPECRVPIYVVLRALTRRQIDTLEYISDKTVRGAPLARGMNSTHEALQQRISRIRARLRDSTVKKVWSYSELQALGARLLSYKKDPTK